MLHENRIKAIERRNPSYIPVGVGILYSAWMKYRDDLKSIVLRYPDLFGDQVKKKDYDEAGGRNVEGEYEDEWGCIWSNVKTGRSAIVTGHAAPTRKSVRELSIPSSDVGFNHGFMYLRLADLRGFEELMVDFAEEPPELQLLIDKVLQYNLRQLKIRMKTLSGSKQIVGFADDLGMQTGLPISPDKWRKYLKPCFSQVYGPVRAAGHYVHMHTDGHILEIIPDLIECGVAILNAQANVNGLENLARVCKGKVCVDLDLNRQNLPFWKPRDIEDHVRSAVEILGDPSGGLWMCAEIDDGVPLENVEALCRSLYRHALRR